MYVKHSAMHMAATQTLNSDSHVFVEMANGVSVSNIRALQGAMEA